MDNKEILKKARNPKWKLTVLTPPTLLYKRISNHFHLTRKEKGSIAVPLLRMLSDSWWVSTSKYLIKISFVGTWNSISNLFIYMGVGMGDI